MSKKIILAGVGLLAIAAMSGCGSTGVFDRERPDEFAVTKAAPLAVPADLNALPTPQPGATGPAKDTKKEVLDAMFGTPKQ
jgi:Protein of unknown function (DUF3035)